MKQLNFEAGQVIFNEGEYATTMYGIDEGAVGIYGNFGKPNEVLLATLGPGEYFGEMGLAECYPRSATAVAKAATTVSEIDAGEFASYFKDRPDVVLTIMRALSARLRETDQRYLEAKQAVYDAIEAERGGKKKSRSLAERLSGMIKFARRSGQSRNRFDNMTF